MNGDGLGGSGSARGSRAGESGPLSRTFLLMTHALSFGSDSSRNSFRRAAEEQHASRVRSPE